MTEGMLEQIKRPMTCQEEERGREELWEGGEEGKGGQVNTISNHDLPNKQCVMLHHFANRTHRYHENNVSSNFQAPVDRKCTNKYHR
jgi:hypothetical protein